MAALKYFVTQYCLSILTGSAWEVTKQTKKPFKGSCKITPDYKVENLGVLTGVEGDNVDGFQSANSINKFEISQNVVVDDMSIIMDEGLQQGKEIGLWFKTSDSETQWGKGYITSVTVSAKDKGSFPEIKIKGWIGKTSNMSAPTIASASGKPLKFNNINITGIITYSIEATIDNGKEALFLLQSGFTDNFPNGVLPMERTGSVKFSIDTDNYRTFNDLYATAEPKIVTGAVINIGSSHTITIAKIAIDGNMERSIQISKDLQIYEVSGTMANDGTNVCFVYA